jgi:hypothetical protein
MIQRKLEARFDGLVSLKKPTGELTIARDSGDFLAQILR